MAAVVLAALFVALLFAVVVDFVLLSVDAEVVFRVRLAAGFFALASVVVASTGFVLAVEAVFALFVAVALVFGVSLTPPSPLQHLHYWPALFFGGLCLLLLSHCR